MILIDQRLHVRQVRLRERALSLSVAEQEVQSRRSAADLGWPARRLHQHLLEDVPVTQPSPERPDESV